LAVEIELGGATHMRQIADLSDAEIRALKRVGFWRSEREPDLPHPGESVDPAWRASEGERLLSYLEQAYGVPYAWCGHSWCRLGCPDISDIGSQDRTDGTYLFPEGLAHYVRVHAVRPPNEFLEHVRVNNYRVPELPALDE
jgi:hypothetical protein